MSKAGVFKAIKKNGTEYYRASITYRNKHISLGSYADEAAAGQAYDFARTLIKGKQLINDYSSSCPLAFEKYVVLVNFRDNGVYIRNPIYLEKRFFLYYLTRDRVFKFDIEDLFYYSEHKISSRGGHLFVADYGMQVNLYSRYGIKPHAVLNRDYRFINGDRYDFRYDNIEIINRYTGVYAVKRSVYTKYSARILVNGLYTIGTYDTETEAAIAYNKAADIIKKARPGKNFRQNDIDSLSPQEYAMMYIKVPISDRIFADFT